MGSHKREIYKKGLNSSFGSLTNAFQIMQLKHFELVDNIDIEDFRKLHPNEAKKYNFNLKAIKDSFTVHAPNMLKKQNKVVECEDNKNVGYWTRLEFKGSQVP